jgi:ribosomal protein S26
MWSIHFNCGSMIGCVSCHVITLREHSWTTINICKIVFTHYLTDHSEGKVSNLLEIKKQNLTLQIECIVRWRVIGQISVRRFLIGSHHCITCELHRNGVGERTSE